MTATRYLDLLAWFARQALAWGLITLVTILGPPALSQPPVTRLLGSLNLSGYPPGERPPEFSSRTATGKTVSLAGLRGRVVLLTFWTTWCTECRPEMPIFEQLHRDFAAEGLTVLGINVREGAPIIQTYAKELDLTFPLLSDPKGEIQTRYGVIGLPTTFLIGRDGRAVALAVGPREWRSPPAQAIIEALLAEPTARKEAG
ncbi:MAG: peroxiredoxin family protein [Candidatus Methylomirabilales bacterium]